MHLMRLAGKNLCYLYSYVFFIVLFIVIWIMHKPFNVHQSKTWVYKFHENLESVLIMQFLIILNNGSNGCIRSPKKREQSVIEPHRGFLKSKRSRYH